MGCVSICRSESSSQQMGMRKNHCLMASLVMNTVGLVVAVATALLLVGGALWILLNSPSSFIHTACASTMIFGGVLLCLLSMIIFWKKVCAPDAKTVLRDHETERQFISVQKSLLQDSLSKIEVLEEQNAKFIFLKESMDKRNEEVKEREESIKASLEKITKEKQALEADIVTHTAFRERAAKINAIVERHLQTVKSGIKLVERDMEWLLALNKQICSLSATKEKTSKREVKDSISKCEKALNQMADNKLDMLKDAIKEFKRLSTQIRNLSDSVMDYYTDDGEVFSEMLQAKYTAVFASLAILNEQIKESFFELRGKKVDLLG